MEANRTPDVVAAATDGLVVSLLPDLRRLIDDARQRVAVARQRLTGQAE